MRELSCQSWKRITQPLADPAFMGGILSQTRAAREKRRPPDPMRRSYHKNAEFQNVACGDGHADEIPDPAMVRLQEPLPGSAEKYFSNFPVSRSYCSRSAGGVPLTVMLGQTRAYWALI